MYWCWSLPGGGHGAAGAWDSPAQLLMLRQRWQTMSPSHHTEDNTFCITPREIPKSQQPGVCTPQSLGMLKHSPTPPKTQSP